MKCLAGKYMRGFTLLEIMISLAILGLSLTALMGIQGGAYSASKYAGEITEASFLAESKMYDIERQLAKDGCGQLSQQFDGDFSDEGISKYRWTASVKELDIDFENLVGQLFSMQQQTQSDSTDNFLSESVEQSTPSLTGDLLSGIGNNISMMLKDSVRAIDVEILWGEEPFVEKMSFMTLITNCDIISSKLGGIQNQSSNESSGGDSGNIGKDNGSNSSGTQTQNPMNMSDPNLKKGGFW